MAGFPKFQTKEVLNKVLNSGEDALKVDIDNVTLKTEGSDITIEVHTDKAEDSMLVFSNTTKDGSGTSYVPLVDSDGHLQVDTVSTALPSGAATEAKQDVIETTLTAIETDAAAIETLLIGIDADTNAIKIDADAIETLITSTNSKIDTLDSVLDNILVKNTEIDSVLDTIKVDTEAIETAVELLDNAIDGSQMQVDVVAALPAGSNAIGKLAANSGVDIGDVDVTSMPTNSATISNQTRDATSYATLTGSALTTDNQGIFSYVIQITSTDNCTLKVQGSNDNSNFVDDDMAEVTIATGASGLISGTSFFKFLRLQFKSSATNGTTVNGQGFAK
tara:strand:- start:419 stop:1420 length:1002 start_codon:yes stop_codon:yes gene_type:complete